MVSCKIHAFSVVFIGYVSLWEVFLLCPFSVELRPVGHTVELERLEGADELIPSGFGQTADL